MIVDRQILAAFLTAAIAATAEATVVAQSAASASAQGPQAQPPAAPVTAGWQDGFFIQSADGAFRLGFGLVAQADGRYVTDDSPGAATDSFVLRKFRPALNGRIARFFDFLMVPDFGSGTTVVQDAYVDARFSPALRLRMGKSKTPIGYEVLMGDPFLLFPERNLVSSLIPNRDVGVQVLGEAAGGKLTYAGGVYNGIPDGSSSTADLDTNASKDFAGRFVVQPFRASAPGPLNGLGFAVGGSTGGQSGQLPSFRTSIGRRYFSYDAASAASGRRTRVQPTVFYYHGPFGGFAEFARSTQEVSRGGLATDVSNHAWAITGSYVLTGEAASDRGVRPARGFDPGEGQWGALQILARYSVLRFDDAAFAAGLVSTSNPREARQLTTGASWYPSGFIKYYAFYELTTFEGASLPLPEEQAIIVRAQVGF